MDDSRSGGAMLCAGSRNVKEAQSIGMMSERDSMIFNGSGVWSDVWALATSS